MLLLEAMWSAASGALSDRPPGIAEASSWPRGIRSAHIDLVLLRRLPSRFSSLPAAIRGRRLPIYALVLQHLIGHIPKVPGISRHDAQNHCGHHLRRHRAWHSRFHCTMGNRNGAGISVLLGQDKRPHLSSPPRKFHMFLSEIALIERLSRIGRHSLVRFSDLC